ncbi:hypothetical protein SH139x_002469 [Planctomycetaceae bacterium SH139]
MKHDSPENWIEHRAELAARVHDSPIDVTDRVLSTLSSYKNIGLAVDKTPLILGGGLMALAASIMLMLLPSLTVMTEPWISFWFI